MSGQTNLSAILQQLQPMLNEGNYVFCTAAELQLSWVKDALMVFREPEGVTLVMRKEQAEQHQLQYDYQCAWITLRVHSSLEAVGLTAAFSTALAGAGISCNVVAGYYHDHIFVATPDAARAMDMLRGLHQ